MTPDTTRRGFLTLAALAVTGATTGCSLLTGSNEPVTDGPAQVAGPVDVSRTLVAYLSVPETDDPIQHDRGREENSNHVIDGRVGRRRQGLRQRAAVLANQRLLRRLGVSPRRIHHECLPM